MITDSDRFSYQKSAYERPTFPYVCGRACAFGKPCSRGPNFDGSCGGTTECRPFRNGDRWECRRPPSAGGPCQDGPLPDGSCCQSHPPCKPRPSLRRRRQQISWLVATFVVAIIGAFLHFSPDSFVGEKAVLSSISPGALSGAHSNFALEEKGCAACHENHGKGVVAWANAFVTNQSVGESCVDCHSFGGAPTSPHNATFTAAAGSAFAADSPSADLKTDCVMCHTEHKGQEANIAPMRDAQCNSCHVQSIKSFGKDHPAFGDRFPHDMRPAIAFDHTSHFSKHFPEKLPEGETRGCVDCHQIEKAGLTVPPGSFDENCASCHLSGIVDRRLALVNVPYMEEDPFDPDAVAEFCAPTPEEVELLREAAATGELEELEPDEYFYEDNGDNVPAALALALGVANDDPDGYLDAIGALYPELAETGVDAIFDRIDALPGDHRTSMMLAGLDGELLRQAACAWMQKIEHETPSDVRGGGWSSDGLAVTYQPSGHADPVARAWFDFAINAEQAAEAADADDLVIEQAAALSDLLTSEYGLGNCTKCHAVTQVTDTGSEAAENIAGLKVEWGYQSVNDRPYVEYDHRPHVNLLGPGTLCTTCHKQDLQAEFAASYRQHDATKFAPGFLPVSQETCTQCHTAGKVRQDCQLCHEYHLEPGFNRTMGFQHQARGKPETGREGG